ncbi:MAG TPA: MFS transporter [Chthoniobacterales bacterium]|nr:MFS transporter [Chthoniobacterales bacterium]
MPTTTKTAQIPEGVTGRHRRIPVGKISFRQTFRALRHRNYRLFFYGQLVSLIGSWMEQTAMSWLVYQITGSKLLLGVVAAFGSAPMMFFSLWGGSLADRYPKRTILICTQTAQMLPSFLLALVAWQGLATPWLLVLIAGVNGVAMGFDMPTRQAFTVEMTSREDLLNAISLNSSIFNGARVIGPSLAGLVIGSLGTATCFLINGFSYIAVIIGLLMMRLPPHVPLAPEVAARNSVFSGLTYVLHHRRVRTILALLGIVGIFGWSYSVLMPAFAREVFHLGANGYGILLSASGVGALIGALTVATAGHAFPQRTIALGGVWFFAGALLGFSLTTNFYLALVFLTLAGFGLLLFFSTSNTVLQTIVPDEMRGRVMGVWGLVFGGMIPLGSLEAGSLASWLGAPIALAFGAVVCAIAGLVALIVIRRREAEVAETVESESG